MKRALFAFLPLISVFFSACASKPVIPPTPPPFAVEALSNTPDGEPVVRLSQKLRDPAKPQILEVLVLPDRGMDIYQIRANLPGRGVVDLLSSPPLEEARAMRGLIVDRRFSTSQEATAEQATLTGVIESDETSDQSVEKWPGKTDVAVTTTLSRGSFVLSIFIKNSGTDSIPIAVGWNPFFNIPSGERTHTRLHLPARKRIRMADIHRTLGSAFDFTPLKGRILGKQNLDDCFTELDRDSQDQAVVELVDPKARYGLRIKAVSDEIKSFQIYAPPEESFAAIEPRFNPGVVRLPPGETAKYVVELELFTPKR
jgi:hypothetical protein